MVKGLHNVFKVILKQLKNLFPTLVESGSEVSHFIPEPRNFAEVDRLLAESKKDWLKSTLKEIKTSLTLRTF